MSKIDPEKHVEQDEKFEMNHEGVYYATRKDKNECSFKKNFARHLSSEKPYNGPTLLH